MEEEKALAELEALADSAPWPEVKSILHTILGALYGNDLDVLFVLYKVSRALGIEARNAHMARSVLNGQVGEDNE